jgi:6-pyruvoyl tetrahydropterin synthase/QueD family protein
MSQGKTRLEIDFGTFDAAHQLPFHGGKCSNLHGHTYRVKAIFLGEIKRGTENSDEGMVIDFSDLKRIYHEKIHTVVDHSLLLGFKALPWMYAIPELDIKPDHYTVQVTAETAEQLTKMGYNKVALIPVPVTTAEAMAEHFIDLFNDALKASSRPVTCMSLTVYETPTAGATAMRILPNVIR